MVRDQARVHRQIECTSHLNQIAVALQAYHGTYGEIPPSVVYGPDGKPWHSWRVLLLEFSGYGYVYDQYSIGEPWNGPNNSRLLASLPNLYGCPCDVASGEPWTSYVAVPPGKLPNRLPVVFRNGSRGAIGSVNAVIVEVCDSGIVWYEPRDRPKDSEGRKEFLPCGHHPDGAVLLFFSNGEYGLQRIKESE